MLVIAPLAGVQAPPAWSKDADPDLELDFESWTRIKLMDTMRDLTIRFNKMSDFDPDYCNCEILIQIPYFVGGFDRKRRIRIQP